MLTFAHVKRQLTELTVQYGLALGAQVVGIDAGESKKAFVEALGAKFVDFSQSSDLVADLVSITNGGAHAVVVTSGHPAAFTHAADLLRIGGALSCVGIPPGDLALKTPIATIVIKGLRISGNLVGSMRETLEAVEMVRAGKVKPHVQVRKFRELPAIYEMLEKGDIPGRIVLSVDVDT
jgi:alcohol dehydrogenase, propanol-preferring